MPSLERTCDGGGGGDIITKILNPDVLCFLNGKESTTGQTITNDVCDCLFYVFPHLKSFQTRYITLYSLFGVLFNKE